MLVAITESSKIKAAQLKMERRLSTMLKQRDGEYTVGFQGGNIAVNELRADDRIWYVHGVDKKSKIQRHWNAFGLATQLNLKNSNTISVEINIPLSGAPRSVAGLFAIDSTTGNHVLMHSGKVGGGKEGIGKHAFLEWYKQTTETVRLGPSTSDTAEALRIAELESPELARQIATFVEAVARFKTAIHAAELASLSDAALLSKLSASKAKPKKIAVETTAYERNIYVVEYVKRRAKGICQLCKCDAPFIDDFGIPYLECHHIDWLANGGVDTVANAVALCPNCHRKMHVVNDPKDVRALKKLIGSRD